MSGYTRELARFAIETDLDDIPTSTRRATERLVLDTVGCMIGGRFVRSSDAMSHLRLAMAGPPQATVAVTGEKVDLLTAVHLNAHYANALDAEETIQHSGHLAAATVPPALAVAEHLGASGADFLAAVAVGFDVAARLGVSLRPLDTDEQGRTTMSTVIGSSWAGFAATVATARLIGLSADQLARAFGVTVAGAPMPIAGRWGQLATPRPMTKYGLYGSIGEAGVAASLLVSNGFDGDMDALDGDRGFWRMNGSVNCDWDELDRDLGKRWHVDQTAYKLYPACQWAVPALHLFFRLLGDAALRAEEVDTVEVLVPEAAIAKFMAEHEVRTVVDGQFSIPHLVALAARGGPPGPQWHTAEMLTDPTVTAFKPRVRVGVFDRAAPILAELIRQQGHAHLIPTRVTITAGDRTFSGESNTSDADRWDFLDAQDDAALHVKFQRFAGAYLSPSVVESAATIITTLERQPDVTGLLHCLVADAAGDTTGGIARD
jgi:2-methylcitrate dehydratase PrpD